MTIRERLAVLDNIQNHFDAIWALSFELDQHNDIYILELLNEFNPTGYTGMRHSLAYELARYIQDLRKE